MATIVVIDYGSGNLRSVAKALEVCAPSDKVVISSDAKEILNADRVVFPGQGAIGQGIDHIDAMGLREAIVESAKNKPFLGVCLGLQALFEFSEENGGVEGLGLLQGQVRSLKRKTEGKAISPPLKIPHMGWNKVHQICSHPLWQGVEDGAFFYFVHSYYVEPSDQSDVAGTTEYGAMFTSAAFKDNIFAVQFHPEKSHKNGMLVLKNFINWNGER